MPTFGEFMQIVNRQEGPVLEVDGWQWGGIKASELDMDIFAAKLAENKTLTSLSLTKTKHTAKHAKQLAEALSTNTVLKSLALCELKILDEGVFALASALRANESLTSLKLSMTGMGTAGVKELSLALKTNRSLKNLSLSGNYEGVTDAGAKSLGELLGTNQSSLTSLDLSNSHVGPAGIIALAHGLSKNTTLATLGLSDLRKIAFSSGKSLDSFAALCAALVSNSALTSIDMFLINIGPEAIELVEGILPMNDSLRKLTIGDAAPGESARRIMAKVRQSRKKTTVDTSTVPLAIAKWLEKWAAGSSSDAAAAASAGSSGMKRKRLTEAERLRAAIN